MKASAQLEIDRSNAFWFTPGAMKAQLERLYHHYNRFQWIHPDPLEFLHRYRNPQDREIVGLIASALAYGRVAQILKSVSRVLAIMGPSPLEYVGGTAPETMAADFAGFVHRFARARHLTALVVGLQKVLAREKSLEACFLAGYLPRQQETVLPALAHLARRITDEGRLDAGHLVPVVRRGSACKRLNLFLRWMVRSDAVDPGGWGDVSPAKLIIPLDVHMHRICRQLQLTRRNAANMATALEVTRGFGRWAPHDPVRYDFALTRFGIRADADCQGLFAVLTGDGGAVEAGDSS